MDIVERLREYACIDKTAWADMVLEAADEIESLRQRITELVAALEWYRDNAYYPQQAQRANVVLAKVGSGMGEEK